MCVGSYGTNMIRKEAPVITVKACAVSGSTANFFAKCKMCVTNPSTQIVHAYFPFVRARKFSVTPFFAWQGVAIMTTCCEFHGMTTISL